MTLNKSLLIVFIILVVDQVSKVYIKLNFPLTIYGELPLFDLGWFRVAFLLKIKGWPGELLSMIFSLYLRKRWKTFFNSVQNGGCNFYFLLALQ